MAEEEQQDVHGGMEPFEAGSADGEEDMEVTTEIKPTLSADDIENAKVEAEKERKRQERLKRELPANLARVEFSQAQAKDIVSHHAGSILANDGPEVPLTDEMLEKAKEVFKELAITFDDPGEEEGEGDGEGEGEGEEEGEGEGEGEGKST